MPKIAPDMSRIKNIARNLREEEACWRLFNQYSEKWRVPITWTNRDLYTAALMLQKERIESGPVGYVCDTNVDLYRALALIFDTLRFQPIMMEAIRKIEFFKRFKEFEKYEITDILSLVAYDFFRRCFTERVYESPQESLIFKVTGLERLDNCLRNVKVKLAAAVTRIRIRMRAFRLKQILPEHVRDIKSTTERQMVTGWVNTFKITTKQLEECFEKKYDLTLGDGKEQDTYRLDPILPRFYRCRPPNLDVLLNSELVENYEFILQDRMFSIGPFVVMEMIEKLGLKGNIAITQPTSFSSCAYLASMAHGNARISKVLIFSAGECTDRCREYFENVGATNAVVYTEEFSSLSPTMDVLRDVVAVWACPRSSYTGKVDPIQLSVENGGNIDLLRRFVDPIDIGSEGEPILEVQRRTLLAAFCVPAAKVVVYTAHSTHYLEKQNMIENVLNEENSFVKEQAVNQLNQFPSLDLSEKNGDYWFEDEVIILKHDHKRMRDVKEQTIVLVRIRDFKEFKFEKSVQVKEKRRARRSFTARYNRIQARKCSIVSSKLLRIGAPTYCSVNRASPTCVTCERCFLRQTYLDNHTCIEGPTKNVCLYCRQTITVKQVNINEALQRLTRPTIASLKKRIKVECPQLDEYISDLTDSDDSIEAEQIVQIISPEISELDLTNHDSYNIFSAIPFKKNSKQYRNLTRYIMINGVKETQNHRLFNKMMRKGRSQQRVPVMPLHKYW